jgi:hypothetical protein
MALTINPAFEGSKTTVLERAGKYANKPNHSYKLKLSSEAPNTYKFECDTFSKDGKLVSGYRENMANPKPERFKINSENLLTKISKDISDLDLVTDVTKFFEGIKK